MIIEELSNTENTEKQDLNWRFIYDPNSWELFFGNRIQNKLNAPSDFYVIAFKDVDDDGNSIPTNSEIIYSNLATASGVGHGLDTSSRLGIGYSFETITETFNPSTIDLSGVSGLTTNFIHSGLSFQEITYDAGSHSDGNHQDVGSLASTDVRIATANIGYGVRLKFINFNTGRETDSLFIYSYDWKYLS